MEYTQHLGAEHVHITLHVSVMASLPGLPTAGLRSGDKMPLIGLGTWKLPNEKATDLVQEAVRRGYRHFDCASDCKAALVMLMRREQDCSDLCNLDIRT